ncbi:MAG: hypothetical protein BRD23_04175 [Halobacteriales archaeon SW_9_67_25]|jgi:hypothetical protein|nr:MAG: hypothetical protein BRD23_04175 [Halobacteriales archaeon SW_9_67_25]
MGYHLVDPAELDQWDDRPTDVRSLSAAAGYEYHDSKIGMRVYDLAPGDQPEECVVANAVESVHEPLSFLGDLVAQELDC